MFAGGEPVYTRDSSGGAVPTFEETAETMYLEPFTGSREGGEVEVQRETPHGQWTGIGRASVDWSSWDEVIYGDITLRIFGTVKPIWNPRLGEESHVEMELREVG